MRIAKIDLLSGTTLSPVRVQKLTTGNFRSEGEDPQFVIKPKNRFEAGWYFFEAALKSEQNQHPEIFFDFGEGFSQIYSARMRPSRGPGIFELALKIPREVLLIRLDPLEGVGEFTFDGLSARKLAQPELALRLAGHAFQVMRENPTHFARRLPVYADALRRPYFLRVGAGVSQTQAMDTSKSYPRWIEKYDFNLDRDRAPIEARLEKLRDKPLISIVMPVYNAPEDLLRAAIESVCSQIYQNWQLCIADDCSTSPHVRLVLEEYMRADARIKVVFRPTNGHISRATGSAFEAADGEWIALLDHDDLLRPHALAEVAFEIDKHPDAELIYSDEDKIDAAGDRYDPFFKPNFSRELFRSQNYLNHLTVHRAQNIRDVGGWRVGFEGSQDYDLNLRIFETVDASKIRHIPKILYHWRAVEGSTASSGDQKSYAFDAGMRALEDHVTRSNLPASVEQVPNSPFYRVRFSVPDLQPHVSLIIPTRDKVELLSNCIESILRKTKYKSYDITVVDNGSVEPKTKKYFEQITAKHSVKVLPYDRPFNFSAMNNFAVAEAKSEMVGLINNDIEVISPDWLTEMVSWAQQKDIGCVGAKLYYGNESIQHAGVILGIGGVAGHSHKYFPRHHPGYFSRLKLVQNLSAVTAACLIVRRSVYLEVGGLNESELRIAFNDVDFCLKVERAGYLNVWTPFAELYHLESISRGAEDNAEKQARFLSEAEYMRRNWLLDNDAYYSINLTREREDFSIAQ